MKFGTILIILGIILVGYSLTLEPFTDIDVFMEKYMSMTHEQSTEFFKLREDMLTPKYRFQDTGIMLILCTSVVMLLLKVSNGKIQSPKKKSSFIILSIALPFITVSGYIFDLFQAMDRIEFPHWADSLGIPLLGAPIQFAILLIWSLAHLGFVKNVKSQSLSFEIIKNLKPWLIFVSSITFIIILMSAYYGQYWYVFPGLIWLYYYLSLGANRLTRQNT